MKDLLKNFINAQNLILLFFIIDAVLLIFIQYWWIKILFFIILVLSVILTVISYKKNKNIKRILIFTWIITPIYIISFCLAVLSGSGSGQILGHATRKILFLSVAVFTYIENQHGKIKDDY